MKIGDQVEIIERHQDGIRVVTYGHVLEDKGHFITVEVEGGRIEVMRQNVRLYEKKVNKGD